MKINSRFKQNFWPNIGKFTLVALVLLLCACAGEIQPTPTATLPSPSLATPIATWTPWPVSTPTGIHPTPRTLPPGITLQGAELVEALRKGGYVIYILATGSEGSQSGTIIQGLEGCSQQNSLSEQGQVVALTIGASFLSLSLPAGQVLYGGSCNSRAMALLAFGRGNGWVSPREFSTLLRGQRIALLRELLSTPPQPGTNTVLVGPDQDITDVASVQLAEGEAVIYKPLGKTGFSFVSRILPAAWEQLESSTTDLVPVEPCISGGVELEQLDPSLALTVGPPSGTDQSNVQVQICRPVPSPTSVQELLLPDLITLPPTELNIRVNAVNEKKLLRFTNSIMNIGPGKIELLGAKNPDTGKVTVSQHIYNAEGSTAKLVVGEFFFHPEHNHWHLGDFARYEIWSLLPDGGLDSVVALGNKVSYCLRDDERSNIIGTARGQSYTSCEQDKQGISVGWIDVYRFDLEGQSIDITTLQEGLYALRSIVDPENHLQEKDPTNNAAILYFEIEGNTVNIVGSQDRLNNLLKGQGQ